MPAPQGEIRTRPFAIPLRDGEALGWQENWLLAIALLSTRETPGLPGPQADGRMAFTILRARSRPTALNELRAVINTMPVRAR
jgi:hypothetical protein